MVERDDATPVYKVTVGRSMRRQRSFFAQLVFVVASAVGVTAIAVWIGPIFGVMATGLLVAGLLLRPRANDLPHFDANGTVAIDAATKTLTVDIADHAPESIGLWQIDAAQIDENEAIAIELHDGRSLRVAANDLLGAAHFLEALGVAPTRVRRVQLLSVADVGPSIGRILGALALIFFLLTGTAGLIGTVRSVADGLQFRDNVFDAAFSFTFMAISFVIARMLVRFFRKGEAVIGADGVLVRSFRSRRFIPYAQVKNVVEEVNGVCLELDDGPLVHLALVFFTDPDRERSANRPPTPEITALAQQIKRAIAAMGKSDASSEKLRELDRGERSPHVWRQAVESLARRAQGYRGVTIEADALVMVAEDGAAPIERRVGAALAIRAGGDPDQKRRVRIAAAGCADADTKAALERAAEGEILEAEIERASRKQNLA